MCISIFSRKKILYFLKDEITKGIETKIQKNIIISVFALFKTVKYSLHSEGCMKPCE